MQSHTMLHMKKVRKAFQDILAFPEARWPRHCEIVDDSITFQQRWGVALTLQQRRANQLRCPTRLSSLVGDNSKSITDSMTHSIPNSPIPNSCEASNKSTTAGSFLVFPVRRLGTPSPTTINHCCQDLSRLRSAVSFHPGWKKAEGLLWLLYVTLLPDMSLRLSVSLSLSPSPRDNMSWLGSFCFWQHLIATCCNSNFGSCTSTLWESSYVRSSLVVWDAMYPKSSISVLCFVPFFEVFVPVRPRRDTLWMKKCHCMPCKKPTQHRRHWITLEYVDATAG